MLLCLLFAAVSSDTFSGRAAGCRCTAARDSPSPEGLLGPRSQWETSSSTSDLAHSDPHHARITVCVDSEIFTKHCHGALKCLQPRTRTWNILSTGAGLMIAEILCDELVAYLQVATATCSSASSVDRSKVQKSHGVPLQTRSSCSLPIAVVASHPMTLLGDAPPGHGTEDEIFGATAGPPVQRPRDLAPTTFVPSSMSATPCSSPRYGREVR